MDKTNVTEDMNQQDTSAAPATEEHLATKSTKTLSNENPDPDEDDLDDLDGIFSPSEISAISK